MDKRSWTMFGLVFLIVLCLLGIFVIVYLLGLSYFQAGISTPTPYQFPTALPTPTAVVPTATPTPVPVTVWKFNGFNSEKSKIGRYEYSWGIFVNANGAKLKAMCSAPNSPSPDIGSAYILDPKTNILYPVTDNIHGNLQRFWYPTSVQ